MQLEIKTEGVDFVVSRPPQPKNDNDGRQKADRETGELLHVTELVAMDETGAEGAEGTTLNFPLPAGATGDVFLHAIDDVLVPVAQRFGPTWLIVSAGFDAHRADPLTGLNLTAGDFADLTDRLLQVGPPGRLIAFLEGGYDLQALALSAGAFVSGLAGLAFRPEPASSGGPGRAVVAAAMRVTRETN